MQTQTILKRFGLLLGSTLAIAVIAAPVSRVTNFVDGEVLTASQLNSEFNNVIGGVNSINNAQVATNAAISPSKLSATIKGDAINRNASTGALSVKTDNTTVEISGDNVQIKDNGVSLAKMADNSVDTAELVDGAVTTAKIEDGAVTAAKLGGTLPIVNPVGSVLMFHTFNSTVSIPRGYMILNGNIVNETNYDAIHGAGAYVADGVASSALLAKNLPDMTSKFAVGSATTTQSGSSAITSVGNTSNQIDLAHTHSDGSLAAEIDISGGSTGYLDNTSSVSTWSSDRIWSVSGSTASGSSRSDGVDVQGSTGSSLSATTSIQPWSIQFVFIMKVI